MVKCVIFEVFDHLVGLGRKGLINDTHSEKLFDLIQYKNDWLAASGLFDMFKQAIKFYYTFHQHIIRVQMFEKCDSSNRQ